MRPHPMRRGGRVVECGGLENRFTRNPGNEGSNPSSSASNFPAPPRRFCFAFGRLCSQIQLLLERFMSAFDLCRYRRGIGRVTTTCRVAAERSRFWFRSYTETTCADQRRQDGRKASECVSDRNQKKMTREQSAPLLLSHPTYPMHPLLRLRGLPPRPLQQGGLPCSSSC